MARFAPKRTPRGVVVRALLWLVMLVVFVVVWLPGAAWAGDDTSLAQAGRDVDASDYLAARSALVSAQNAGTASPSELAEIYRLSGIVEAALGNTAAATAAFERWLALDPKAALPPGTSPKMTRPFNAAAELARTRGPLKVKTETASDPPSVTLVIASDPVGLVSRVRVLVIADGKREQAREGAGKGRIKIALPRGKRLDLRVQALDEHGNRVVELGSVDVPIVITGAGDEAATTAGAAVKPPSTPGAAAATRGDLPRRPAPRARPLWARWWLWGSVAVASGAVGGYFGLQARSEANALEALNATSQDHTFTEAQAVESRARRDLLVFDIGMGAAAACTLGAVLLYLTEPKRTTETRLTAVPVQGGGALVLGGQF